MFDKILLFPFLFIVFASSTKHFEIHGQIDHAKNGSKVLLYTWGADFNFHTLDSTSYQDGFHFSGTIDETNYAMIEVVDEEPRHRHIYFILEGGHIQIKKQAGQYVIEGGIQNEYLNQENRIRENYRDRLKELERLASEAKNNDEQLYRLYRDSISSDYDERTHFLETLYLNNPNAFVGLLYTYSHKAGLSTPTMAQLYGNLTQDLQEHTFGKLVLEYLKAEDLQFALPITHQIDTALNPINIVFPTGTYTLIDFWASWCIPCRKTNPDLIKLYDQYERYGLNIIGISADSDIQKWKGAIQEDGMKWMNLTDLNGWANTYLTKNGVKSLPTYILVDPEGRIVFKETSFEEMRMKTTKIFEN